MRAIPFTSNKGLSIQAAGANAGTWGAGAADSLNTAVQGYLDLMLGGFIAFGGQTGGTLTFSQAEARNACYRLAGTLTSNLIVTPGLSLMTGFYFFENLCTGNFTVTYTNPGGSVAIPQSRNVVLWCDPITGPRIIAIAGSTVADAIPAGSSILFYNTTVPSGWTGVALNDYGIRVVNSGGGTALTGSVAYSTVFARTATDSTTLTTDQIPSHSHPVKYNTITSITQTGSATATQAITGAGANTAATEVTGGGNGHTHGNEMRVQTVALVIGTRN